MVAERILVDAVEVGGAAGHNCPMRKPPVCPGVRSAGSLLGTGYVEPAPK
jgi:hypothetical protein